MRYLFASLAAVCLLSSSSKVFGQNESLPNLSGRLVVVHFSVVEGRIDAAADQPGFEREQTTTVDAGRHETLSVSTNNEEEASVHYELATDAEQLSVDVVDGFDLSVSRRQTKLPHATNVEFRQPRTGPITLTVEQDGIKREVRGETIWYLFLAEPELCRQHLMPLLGMLRADWRLIETAQAIELQMLQIASAYDAKNLRRWSSLVGDLANDRYIVRQSAERELRDEGTTVVPFLRSLNRHELELEQASRIDSIIDSGDDSPEDTSEQQACQLMDNRSLWLVLMGRPRLNTRLTAARQLAFLLGTDSLRFDPGAADAVRNAQLESLKSRVEALTAPATNGSE